jgi:hypothetical protein
VEQALEAVGPPLPAQGATAPPGERSRFLREE